MTYISNIFSLQRLIPSPPPPRTVEPLPQHRINRLVERVALTILFVFAANIVMPSIPLVVNLVALISPSALLLYRNLLLLAEKVNQRIQIVFLARRVVNKVNDPTIFATLRDIPAIRRYDAITTLLSHDPFFSNKTSPITILKVLGNLPQDQHQRLTLLFDLLPSDTFDKFSTLISTYPTLWPLIGQYTSIVDIEKILELLLGIYSYETHMVISELLEINNRNYIPYNPYLIGGNWYASSFLPICEIVHPNTNYRTFIKGLAPLPSDIQKKWLQINTWCEFSLTYELFDRLSLSQRRDNDKTFSTIYDHLSRDDEGRSQLLTAILKCSSLETALFVLNLDIQNLLFDDYDHLPDLSLKCKHLYPTPRQIILRYIPHYSRDLDRIDMLITRIAKQPVSDKQLTEWFEMLRVVETCDANFRQLMEIDIPDALDCYKTAQLVYPPLPEMSVRDAIWKVMVAIQPVPKEHRNRVITLYVPISNWSYLDNHRQLLIRWIAGHLPLFDHANFHSFFVELLNKVHDFQYRKDVLDSIDNLQPGQLSQFQDTWTKLISRAPATTFSETDWVRVTNLASRLARKGATEAQLNELLSSIDNAPSEIPFAYLVAILCKSEESCSIDQLIQICRAMIWLLKAMNGQVFHLAHFYNNNRFFPALVQLLQEISSDAQLLNELEQAIRNWLRASHFSQNQLIDTLLLLLVNSSRDTVVLKLNEAIKLQGICIMIETLSALTRLTLSHLQTINQIVQKGNNHIGDSEIAVMAEVNETTFQLAIPLITSFQEWKDQMILFKLLKQMSPTAFQRLLRDMAFILPASPTTQQKLEFLQKLNNIPATKRPRFFHSLLKEGRIAFDDFLRATPETQAQRRPPDHFNISRKDLNDNCSSVALQLAAFDSLPNFEFEGERGVDQGGPTREVITQILTRLAQDPTLFTPDSQSQLSKPYLKARMILDFTCVGKFMGFALQNGVAIGDVFDRSVFSAMLAFSDVEVGMPQLPEAAKRVVARAYLNDPMVKLGGQTVPLFDNLDNQKTLQVMGYDSPEEAYETVPFTALQKMAFHLRSTFNVSSFTPEQLMQRLHGITDPAAVAQACKPTGVLTIEMQNQLQWLQEWISQSVENAELFLVSATGSKALPLDAGKQAITIAWESLGEYNFMSNSTCFRSMALSSQPRYLALTKEQFKENLKPTFQALTTNVN